MMCAFQKKSFPQMPILRVYVLTSLDMSGVTPSINIPNNKLIARPVGLPKLKVKPYGRNSKVFHNVDGNFEEEFASSKITSTYPTFPDKTRFGDPIADKIVFTISKNRTIVAVADGCGWGQRSALAAERATSTVNNYLRERHELIRDIQDAGHYLYRAFSVAHDKIIEGRSNEVSPGTTTLICGLCMEVESEDDSKSNWGFICASVGDCKAFVFKNGEVVDLTIGNRLNLQDAKDPGGRLGDENPDLRNLGLYYVECQEGDIIIIVSDGVHDNLDPVMVGKQPKDCGINAKSWDEVDKQTLEKVKNEHRVKVMKDILAAKTVSITPSIIASSLVDYCFQLTQKKRDYMEQNPSKGEPYPPSLEFPGKTDHTSACAFKVGAIESLSLGPEEDVPVVSIHELSVSPPLSSLETPEDSEPKAKRKGSKSILRRSLNL